MATIKMIREIEEDSYTAYVYDIYNENGEKVGDMSLMVDSDGAYCERIDIDEAHRNHGYGTDALNLVSDEFDGVMVAPDNETAKRLYERIGREIDYSYIDQGYGVYSI